MKRQGPTEAIAESALSYRYETLPVDVRRLAKLAILDNLGCAIRGAKEPLSQFIGQELFGRRIDAYDLLQGRLCGPLHSRAMLHAGAAHALDYDDTLVPAQSAHAGSAVVGASLPLACEIGVSGSDFIAAVVAGYETASRVGSLLHPDHYLLGFHPTATVGVFGAAAAAGKLMQLDRTQMLAALGLAATQACGLKCTFGTMAKPYNAAHAASAGLLAARLVARGFSAPLNALEGEKGYLSMFLGLPEAERQIEGPDIFRIRDNAFKFHAACHATHPMIEALLALSAEHAINVERIDRIEVSTTALSLTTASIGQPRSGLEAKFSFSHVAALTLAGHDTSADEAFSQAAISNKMISMLRSKVYTNDLGTHPFETTVVISTLDGQRYKSSFDFRILAKSLDTVSTRIESKFIVNASNSIRHDHAQRIQTGLMHLGEVSDMSRFFHFIHRDREEDDVIGACEA